MLVGRLGSALSAFAGQLCGLMRSWRMGFAIGSAVCLLVGAARWTWVRVEVMSF
jgi:hypothetical protein